MPSPSLAQLVEHETVNLKLSQGPWFDPESSDFLIGCASRYHYRALFFCPMVTSENIGKCQVFKLRRVILINL